MTRAILRSFASGLSFVALVLLAEVVLFGFFCPQHRAWVRTMERNQPVVLDGGYKIAREHDSIFVCTTRHCLTGPICHQDRACYCAPAERSPEQVAAGLPSASCLLDHARPTAGDDDGACRHAHCDEHIGP
jgi:hypothetical protein